MIRPSKRLIRKRAKMAHDILSESPPPPPQQPSNEDRIKNEIDVEQRVMRLLENPDLAGMEPESSTTLVQPSDYHIFDSEADLSREVGRPLMMTADELKLVEALSERATEVLDDFNFGRTDSYPDFINKFKDIVTEENEIEGEITENLILQFLQYQRIKNPPPMPKEVVVLNEEEASEFMEGAADEDLFFYLDLYNFQEIDGIETIGLLFEKKLGKFFDESTIRHFLHYRAKHRPPPQQADIYGPSNQIITAGYLSHDYWPSLLCVPVDEHHCRYFNLTNTRNDGFHRYYRCSRCCTIKVAMSKEQSKQRRSADYKQSAADFVVPKIQVHGDQVVTNCAELIHYPECKPIPVPLMLAEQLDRRARRQACLGLRTPRDAWTEAYFEALYISDAVSECHPGFPSVAELFPSYEKCRGQYSRIFHKYRRTISLPPEYEMVVDKRRLIHSIDDLGEYRDMPYSVLSSPSRRRKRLRRGQEADELIEAYSVPSSFKREIPAGYVAVEEDGVEFSYLAEPGADGSHEYYTHGNQHPIEEMDEIEQEEIVVTDEPIVRTPASVNLSTKRLPSTRRTIPTKP